MENLILNTDSYKASHWLQYPPGTTSMFSYVESRGGLYPKTVFFGLQYILQKYLHHHNRICHHDVHEARTFFEAHGEPFNEAGWLHVVNKHGGRLPVRIRAVREGSVLSTGLPLITVESTDPEAFWVVSWLETMLMRVWYPINVATLGYYIKQDIKHFLEKTADNLDGLDFKLHDFGARGVSSTESSAIGGMAHLVNFKGSDTVAGVVAARKHYGEQMAAFSIPAAEHSSITSWGRENEAKAYANMLDKFAKPGALVACVSDSYNIYDACEKLWGGELKQKVIDSGATLIVRPDSGIPHFVVAKCLDILGEKFGYTTNSKGYKVLNNVRVIQGDGINRFSINQILNTITNEGWSADNVAFGMGGALLQQHDRDTQKFAMKCSSITVNGEERTVYKDPVDDHGKVSKKGRLDTEYFEGYRATVLKPGQLNTPYSIMQTVYENGEIMSSTTLTDVRKRVNQVW